MLVPSGRITMCFRDGKPVGLMWAHLMLSVFDPGVRFYRQQLLYGEKGTRAAYLLMEEFIDYGRKHADHIITMIGANTNIKCQSLEKRGFRKLEELYICEV